MIHPPPVSLLVAGAVLAIATRLPAAPASPAPAEAPAPPAESGPLAILTPTAAADQEESRQDVARILVEVLHRKRPEFKVVALTQTLSALNAAGLAKPYEEMYATYRSTGLLDVQLLRKIGQATGSRLLLQLKLTGFQQDTKDGLAFFGLTLTHRETADAHLLGQIWDSSSGKIVWEKAGSASKSNRSVKSKTIPLEDVVRAAAEDLVRQLPD